MRGCNALCWQNATEIDVPSWRHIKHDFQVQAKTRQRLQLLKKTKIKCACFSLFSKKNSAACAFIYFFFFIGTTTYIGKIKTNKNNAILKKNKKINIFPGKPCFANYPAAILPEQCGSYFGKYAHWVRWKRFGNQ